MTKKTYEDMSVQACADRYNAQRLCVLARIKSGAISASLSGIEDYPAPFEELGDPEVVLGGAHLVKHLLTWNGAERIERPDWAAEYEAWLASLNL